MSTKSFKDICIEYASQLGKGLPLTPAEMLNAVVNYMNTQFDSINNNVNNISSDFDALSNNVPTLSGRNVFEGDNSFNTLDSKTVTAKNRFNLDTGIIYTYGSQYTAQFPNKTGTVVYTSELSGYAELSDSNNWTGQNTFRGGLYCVIDNNSFIDNSIIHARMINNKRYKSYGSLTNSDDICITGRDIIIFAPNKPRYMSYPSKEIMELLTSEDIPNYNEIPSVIYSAGVAQFTYTDGNIKLSVSGGNKINVGTNKSSSGLVISSEIYYTSFFSTTPDSVIAFACITTTNLQGEIGYSELNSTISGLGYSDENNVLPASGIINSKNVYGIWSDGTTIHCLCTDFTQEDLPYSTTTSVKSV